MSRYTKIGLSEIKYDWIYMNWSDKQYFIVEKTSGGEMREQITPNHKLPMFTALAQRGGKAQTAYVSISAELYQV